MKTKQNKIRPIPDIEHKKIAEMIVTLVSMAVRYSQYLFVIPLVSYCISLGM